jgi:3-phosphoglycerate kinase
LIGGGMAYTFVKAEGLPIGSSKLDEEGLKLVPGILEKAKKKGVKVIVSHDWVIADGFKEDAKTKLADNSIPDGWMGLDIGPKTIESFKKELSTAKLVLWNGPLGVFEWSAFEKGTKAIAEYLTQTKATVVVGGGDSAAAIKKYGLENKVAHVSTGGGASLEYLEGEVLPGIACLQEVK